MSLSERDKKLLVIIVPLAVVLGYWFLLLAPKREAAATAETTLQSEQATLAEAEANANTVSAAKANFARDYAAVVALGKAIPSSVDMPSLLVQLQQAAQGTGIELAGVTAGEREPVTETAPTGTSTPTTPTAPSGQPPQSAPGAAAANTQAAADDASAGNTASDPSAAGTATTPAAGTAPAPAALETVSLEFKFTGEFFSLADFFHRLKRFVYVEGDKVRVRGRLMTIDGVEYTADADTFPLLTATVQATVYLSPKTEGVTAGATPAGPQAASVAPVPATTTASSGSSSPTPTATTTP